MSFADAVDAKARELCRHVVRMTTEAESGHPSTGTSLAHLTVVLMYHKMRYDLANPWNPRSDRLVLSEGHAVPIIYAAYADLGGVFGADPAHARKLTIDDLWTLRDIDSALDGHPNPAVGFPFFDAATGSLGQGISVACGLGLAARLDASDRTVYVICGDGESREGQIWEALDFIADHGLTNVRVIFNANGMGQSDYVSTQQSPETLARKVEAYGLHAEVIDGHDPGAVSKALSLAPPDGKPVVVIAKTIKGWGVSELQQVGYHGKPLSAKDVEQALAELAPPAATPDMELCPAMPKGEIPKADRGPIAMPDPDWATLAADQPKLAQSAAKGKLATRHAYGLTLRALGEASDRIVALDADVSNSTFSEFFAKRFPDRYFECRIAEQNMCSTAAGLAAAGKIPFANSFAKFLVRAYDQIEMAANTCANVKIVGSHSGVSLGADGPSQMGVVDTAFFGSLASVTTPKGQPGAVVLNPCDAVSAYRLSVAMANHDGLVYMRTLRPATTILYKPGETFDLVGQKVLADGDDLTLVAWGYMVHEARKVAERLASDGIACRLVDAYSLPLAEKFAQAAGLGDGAPVLVLEDNYAGGLGAAVAVAAGRVGNVRLDAVTPARMPKSGKTADDVLAYVGMDLDAICRRAKALVTKA
ncbi:MAG: transketolase [Planctomycetes bacterium]|nr:transketolase [Planctomycetota bacterium]